MFYSDKHQDDTKEEAEKKFREIADAHDVLTDPGILRCYTLLPCHALVACLVSFLCMSRGVV
jgi:preprotein translocase subunit Sec63